MSLNRSIPDSRLAAQPQVNPPASFMVHDRIRAISGDTFHNMLGTILSVHGLSSARPFAFVQLDDKRYAGDKLYFALDELVGSSERKAVQA